MTALFSSDSEADMSQVSVTQECIPIRRFYKIVQTNLTFLHAQRFQHSTRATSLHHCVRTTSCEHLWLMSASLSLLNKAVNTLCVCKLRRHVILHYVDTTLVRLPANVIHATTYRKAYITHLSPTKSLGVSEQNAQRQFTRLLLRCVTVWLRETR